MQDQEQIETDEQQQEPTNEQQVQEEVQPEVQEQSEPEVDDEIVKLTKNYSKQQIQNALQLATDLADPEKAADVIADLASRVKPKVTQKVPAPVAVGDVLAKMKAKVPQEYGLIIDALAPAILEAIDAKTQITTEQIQELSMSVQEAKVSNEYNAAVSNLRKEYKDFDSHLEAITNLSTEILIAPGVPVEKYIKNLYLIANGNARLAEGNRRAAATINENSQRGIRSPSIGATNGTVRNGTALPSLDEAFAAGARGERF